MNGTSYSVGVQGDEVILSVGTQTTDTDSSAVVGTEYYYKIYAFNGSGVSTAYRTTEALSGQIRLFAEYLNVFANRTEAVSSTASVSAGLPAAGVTVMIGATICGGEAVVSNQVQQQLSQLFGQ